MFPGPNVVFRPLHAIGNILRPDIFTKVISSDDLSNAILLALISQVTKKLQGVARDAEQPFLHCKGPSLVHISHDTADRLQRFF